jgi:hypothetical protein
MIEFLLLIFFSVVSSSIHIPSWDFHMNEHEITIGNRLMWISIPTAATEHVPVYISLVIDPFYPESQRNQQNICKSFGYISAISLYLSLSNKSQRRNDTVLLIYQKKHSTLRRASIRTLPPRDVESFGRDAPSIPGQVRYGIRESSRFFLQTILLYCLSILVVMDGIIHHSIGITELIESSLRNFSREWVTIRTHP